MVMFTLSMLMPVPQALKGRLLEVKPIDNSITSDPEFKSSSCDWAPLSLPVMSVINFKILWWCFCCKHGSSLRYLSNQFSDGGLPSLPPYKHARSIHTRYMDMTVLTLQMSSYT